MDRGRINDGETFKVWTARNEPAYLAKLITERVASTDAVAVAA